MTAATSSPAQIIEGVNGRAFLRHENLTLKERNAARKTYEADGWTVKTFGSNRRGWTIEGWKGEPPAVIRQIIGIGHPQHDISPLYRIGGERFAGYESIDGTPERED